MLEITGLTKVYASQQKKRFGRERAVDRVSLTVGQGEFFTLLGPSGCGKTTMLRSVGGLESPTEGTIVVDDRTLFCSDRRVDVPANERHLGMVFQSYAIWPHMSVFQNVAYPLVAGRRKTPAAEVRKRVGETLEIMGLGDLANRGATDLSGGQQQRLALARALVYRPPLLLLDEPLSNLDAKLRESMRKELIRLQRELGLTVLYVTHDQDEALAMSTVVAVMSEGRVEQLGTPRDIYEKPKNWFVADFIGSANFMEGDVVGPGEAAGEVMVETPLGRLSASGTGAEVAGGTKVTAMVRPERIKVSLEANRAGQRGVVRTAVYQGDVIDYDVEVHGALLRIKSGPDLYVEPGVEVTVGVPDQRCVLVAD